MSKCSMPPQAPLIPKEDAFVQELQRLLACYQLADANERKLVWSVLNKYIPEII